MVTILGHIGNPRFPIHEDEIIKKAIEKNILIEINNSSFVTSRKGSDKNCTSIAKLCKEFGSQFIVNSDAHFCFSIGNFSVVDKMLKEIGMPEELVINTSEEKLLAFLKGKGKNL